MPANRDIQALKDLRFVDLTKIRFRIVDAKDQVVGVLASQLIKLLTGKDKPTWNRYKEMGDMVIVTNCAHVVLTQDKWENKMYKYRTGWGRHRTKELSAQAMWQRDPTRILAWAVNGMLPKDQFRRYRMEYKLKLYPEDKHPFGDFNLVPYVPPPYKFGPPAVSYMIPRGLEPLNPVAYQKRLTTRGLGTRRRPEMDFRDLMTEQERNLLAAAEALEAPRKPQISPTGLIQLLEPPQLK